MKAKTRTSQIYDDSFKRKVVDEFLKGKLTKIELRRKYNIGGKSAILTWMRQLGYSDDNRWPKKIKFRVGSTHTSMSPTDKDKLEKENQELKRKLEDERLRSEAYLRIIEKAEEELKISLKKKFNSK